jgi:Uma2 family endonuclease
LANLFPYQGAWSEEEYLALDTNHLIEFSQGYLEVLPMPTIPHQDITIFLFEVLKAFVVRHLLGKVYIAPVRVRIGRREYREPDVIFISNERWEKVEGNYPDGGDLVMEVVSGSPADRDRDLVRKRRDYALAGIPEYWIIDPQEEVIFVLRLEGKEYVEHGHFGAGDVATSALLPGFSVAVSDVWDAAKS